ncbi:MAG: dTDP-4-dehydrorhamnose reductase [Enterobacteriaceae bacterium]
MKILLIGKNGQLGSELLRSLTPPDTLTAVDHAECDLAKPSSIHDLLFRIRPDVIVNAAAYTAVDKAETEAELVYAINAVAPGIIGEAALKLGALVVHYSTDYVFDGAQEGFYKESDRPNPQNVYGASKLAGERALQASGARHLIFRTSWLLGTHGHNFAKTILRLAAKHRELNVVADQFGAPTPAPLVADITCQAIRQSYATSLYGVYHLAAAGVTNWYEYACHLIERARSAGHPLAVLPGAIRPVASKDYLTPARRPSNSRLDTQKLCQTFGLMLPNWRDGVDDILDKLL